MKLVIAAEIFPPDIGGPATYSKRLAEALIARGWDVELVCYSDKKHDDDPAYVHRVTRSTLKPLHYYNYYRMLKQWARDCDVIYAQGPVGSGRPALRVAKILKKKLVVKVVGDYAWERARNSNVTDILIDEFQGKTFGGKIGMLQKVEREVCRGADRVIVPSQYLKKIVTGWGVSSESVSVIYNAFEAPEFDRKPSRDNNLVISVARLVPWKGLDTLIAAVNELNGAGMNLKLVIAGDGPDRDRLNALIKQTGARAEIVKMAHGEVLSLMSKAGIFVLNSGYEGLSHVILEALAAHVPVVASDVGGNPELITDGVNGVLIPYNDKESLKQAIKKVYGNEQLSQLFMETSHEVLEQFQFETIINQTEQLLHRLMIKTS